MADLEEIYENITAPESSDLSNLPEVQGDIFYYFAYGSNMLSERIHYKNPTAVKIGQAVLKNYRVSFSRYSPIWYGSPATIVPEENAVTYGMLWTMRLSDMSNIDRQEGVHVFLYEPLSVPVTLTANETFRVHARAYVIVENPPPDAPLKLPESPGNLPSKSYVRVMVKGAIESQLPPDYIQWIRSLKHNGVVREKYEQLLDLSNIELVNP